jgi:iron complex transport system substrate-binding protein
MRLNRLFFIILFINFFLPAAWSQTLTVEDTAGRLVQTPQDPDRIVCLGPGALRLIIYLQAEKKVCGVEDMEKMNHGGRPYWIAHPELHGLPRCGPGGPASINKKPDLEALLSINPDVIFITYMARQKADEVQNILNIPVVVLTYGPFSMFDESIYQSLETAGRILNREERAEEVRDWIEGMKNDLQQRGRQVKPGTRIRAYVGGIGNRGSHGIESTKKDYAPLDWTGAVNAAKKVKSAGKDHIFMDKEILLQLDPEYIFIDGGGLSLVREDIHRKPEFYRALKAFRNQHVYILHPFNFYTTNIGTALADAYAIGRILYPDEFSDVEIEAKADSIYTFLVGKPVYHAMKKDYGPLGAAAGFFHFR